MESASREVMTMKYENEPEGAVVELDERGGIHHQKNHLTSSSKGPSSAHNDDPPLPFIEKSMMMGAFQHEESSPPHPLRILPSLDEPPPPTLLPASSTIIHSSSNSVAQQSDHIIMLNENHHHHPHHHHQHTVHRSKSLDRKSIERVRRVRRDALTSVKRLLIHSFLDDSLTESTPAAGGIVGSSHQLGSNHTSSSNKLKVELLNAPSLFESYESGLGKEMSIMNLLHPPQVSSSKVQKRGPGRPRKDVFAPGKMQRLPSGLKKSFLGWVIRIEQIHFVIKQRPNDYNQSPCRIPLRCML
jgi:hypothetical protein